MVDLNFKFILITTPKQLESLDEPFLNRFEKHNLSPEEVLKDEI